MKNDIIVMLVVLVVLALSFWIAHTIATSDLPFWVKFFLLK